MTVAEKIQALRGRPVTALTAYDYPMAKLMDECGVDVVLVGDSLGMLFAGFEDTTFVSMDQMIYHTSVVRRAVNHAFLVSDLSFHSYDTPAQAVANARRLRDAGAEAVKLEGGAVMIPQVRAILEDGIPVVGHIGMLPQSVREEKGYKKKGKTSEEAERLIEDARQLSAAGVAAIVVEGTVPSVAARITQASDAPTIGIGSGPDCDGQVAVIHDVLGFYPWFVPPFAKPRADFAAEFRRAIGEFLRETRGE